MLGRVSRARERPGRIRAASVRTVTVERVPIVGTGRYPLSSGPHTFTEEELRDAVAAAQDPSLGRARLRLGHEDGREGFDGLTADGEPALGTVGNLALTEDGQEVIADFEGVPDDFREVAEIGYPGLSIEGELNHRAPSGRTYRLWITDVSLLGATRPAITSLGDLRDYFRRARPVAATSFRLAASAEQVAARHVLRELARRLAAAATPSEAARIAAEADVDDLRLRYYETVRDAGPEALQAGPGPARWVRSIRVADDGRLYLVVDDGEGRRYRVDVTASGDEVTFSEPTPVAERYVSVQAGMAAPDDGGRVLATYADREGNHPQEGNSMNAEQRRALARRLGQPEDADEATLLAAPGAAAALAAMLAEPAGGDGGNGGGQGQGSGQPQGQGQQGQGEGGGGQGGGNGSGGTGQGQGEGGGQGSGESAGQGQPEPVAAGAGGQGQGEGVVTLDATTYRDWEQTIRQFTEQQQRDERERRNRIVATAVTEGRIPPARREHWRQAFDRDPQGTETALTAAPEQGGLMPNLIPVIARGAAPDDEADAQAEDAVMTAYIERHFGNVVAKGQRRRQHSRVVHRTEA
jgi:hypothetical protein